MRDIVWKRTVSLCVNASALAITGSVAVAFLLGRRPDEAAQRPESAERPGRASDRLSRPRAERPAPGRPRSRGLRTASNVLVPAAPWAENRPLSIEQITGTGKMESAGNSGPSGAERGRSMATKLMPKKSGGQQEGRDERADGSRQGYGLARQEASPPPRKPAANGPAVDVRRGAMPASCDPRPSCPARRRRPSGAGS